jgi:hypothetical protein
VGPGQDLHCLCQLGVSGHLAVVVPVRPDEVGQDLGVPRVGLGSRGGVAVPVPGGREWVHRVDPVTSRHQCPHQQAPVGLDAHQDLAGVLGVLGHHGMEPGQPLYPIEHPALGQDGASLVEHADVVVGLRPVDPHEDHLPP